MAVQAAVIVDIGKAVRDLTILNVVGRPLLVLDANLDVGQASFSSKTLPWPGGVFALPHTCTFP